MIDQNSILNDPTMVPLVKHGGICFITHDGRFLIAESSLNIRFKDATLSGRTKNWLRTYPRYVWSRRK